jgi:hypothetical protein
MTKQTQYQRLVELLLEQWVSPLDAMKEAGCMRLAARINDIRNDPDIPRFYKLEDRWAHTKNKFGDKIKYKEYRLVKRSGRS